jgi:hypothetical protein
MAATAEVIIGKVATQIMMTGTTLTHIAVIREVVAVLLLAAAASVVVVVAAMIVVADLVDSMEEILAAAAQEEIGKKKLIFSSKRVVQCTTRFLFLKNLLCLYFVTRIKDSMQYEVRYLHQVNFCFHLLGV